MVRIYTPHPKYPTVSITGTNCQLACDYCRRLVLRTMVQIRTSEALQSFCSRLKARGGLGCLLSGGFDKQGKLPFTPYLDALGRVKKELGLILSIHPGFVNQDEATQLREAGIDIAEFYVVTSDGVLGDVMHLKLSKHDARKSLDAIYTHGPPHVAPHITVGADHGKVSWEYEAIEVLRDYDPYVVIFLVLVPMEGTPMANVQAPPIDEVLDLFAKARKRLPDAELALGCMRVRGSYTESLEAKLLQRELVDRLTIPYTRLNQPSIEACCSLPDSIMQKCGLAAEAFCR